VTLRNSDKWTPRLSHCLPGCKEPPVVVFCDAHWKHVPKALQDELLKEMARLRPGTTMTTRLATLLKAASLEVELKLKGAGKVHDVGKKGLIV
jgi:hypothetical protein